MIFTLFLTVSTGISMSTGSFISGHDIYDVKEATNEILAISEDEMNPSTSSYFQDKSFETVEDFIKIVMLNSLVQFKFVDEVTTKTTLNYINQECNDLNLDFDAIQNSAYDNHLFDFGDFDSSIVNAFFELLHESDKILSHFNNGNIPVEKEEITTKDSDEYNEEDKRDIEEMTDETQIPLIPNHDNSQMEANVNCSIDGYTFLGFDFPADTCISFYNIISDWLNKKAMMTTIGASTIWKYIVNLIRFNPVSSTLYNQLFSLLSGLWDSLISFLKTGTIGLIISIILSIVAIGTLSVVISIYIAGLNQKGWRIGLLIYNWHHWEWLCGEY